jgi:hypothetical protein
VNRDALLGLFVVGAVALIATYFASRSVGGLVNEGINSVVKDLTGGAAAGGEDTLGGLAARFREWISGDDAKIRAMLEGAPPAPGALQPTFSSLESGELLP